MKSIKMFLSFSFGNWVGALIGVITIPVMTRFFSPEEFGKASMFNMALNILMLITMFGIDQAFVRFFYEEKTKELLNKCLKLTFTVYLFILLIFFVFRESISIYLFDIYDPLIIFLLGISSLLYVLNKYSVLILRMNLMSWQYSFTSIGIRLFELIFVIMFFYLMGNGYTTIVIAKIATVFLVTVIAVYLGKQSLKRQDDRPVKNKNSLKDILKYSYPLALTGLLTMLLQSVDKIAIKEWSTYEELGIYVAGFRIVAILDVLVASFTTYWTPLALERFVNNNNETENKEFYKKANTLISCVMLIAAIGIIMFKDVVVLLLGENYKNAAMIMPFLVFTPLMYVASETTVIGINFYKKVRWHLVISVIVLIINIGANICLVPYLGSKGAALAAGISALLFFVLRTHISLKYYKIQFLLAKFYLLVFLLMGYAVYSTFYEWNFYNVIFGSILLLLTVVLYYKDLKVEIEKYFVKN